MTDIVFSSWGGRLVDNRGQDPGTYESPDLFNLPETFKAQEKIKALIGWDGIILRSGALDIVDLCRVYLEALHESSKTCGKCNYCTTGYKELLEVIADIQSGEATEEDLEFLKSAAEAVMDSSKCSIGKAGPTPLFHALKYFPEAFHPSTRGEGGEKVTCYSKLTAPCMDACPIHLDIPKYVELIKDAKFPESLGVIREKLPLPGVVGRVCYHPCEQHCRRANADEPIAIRLLKRFVADQEWLKGKGPEFQVTLSEKGGKAAIVGAGPAGLACAYHLALKGHEVTIFEKQPLAGGMMAIGIPEYRLPGTVVQSEIEAIQNLGVTIKTGLEIGKDLTTEQLRKEGYQAVFISIGAHECKKLGLPGEDLEGVYPGVDFLREVRLGEKIMPGKRVAVIGGGNVAIDAVRTARRLGVEEAFIIYRRSREEMPALEEEIKDCEAEGIRFHLLTNPKRIIGENGKVKAIECLKMTLGQADASGRPRPIPVEGSEFLLEVDGVIPALGQESDWACLGPDCACTLTEWGTMKFDPFTLQTEDPFLFAGGDAALGPRSLIEAGAMGKKAALAMDRLINGLPLTEGNDDYFDLLFKTIKIYNPEEVVKVSEVRNRKDGAKLNPETRKASFEEVEQGFSPAEAVAEAERCLRCYRVVTIAV
ncbi:MAG: FAD-dependent oxidoreductase [Deltaproteobacteria bacterium]|nr:FAD-dependent oxidoreductase [Deltaproteobacteria bacterium]